MTAPAQPGLRYALLMLFLINFLNFFDRVIPAVVLEPIRKEFGLDDTMLGLLGTSFTLIYALAGLPLGRLSDKMRRTWVLSGGVFVWSLMTAASGAAWNFISFFLIRLGVGIGEASCAPASNSMIGDMYPSKQRARALGLFMLGLPLGQLASFVVVGYLPRGRLLLGAGCMIVAAPLLWLGFTRPAGAVVMTTALLSAGWLLYFMYFVTVYPAVQDVVDARLRATAMAVYFFFQYVLGAGFGAIVTGIISDYYGKQAMLAAGITQMDAASRAIGLQSSLSLVVPLSILITGVALWFAAQRFVADAARVSADAAAAAPR
jgi:MFS family permease